MSSIRQGHSDPYSASLFQMCPVPKRKAGRQMIKMFRNKSPSAGTLLGAAKEEGV